MINCCVVIHASQVPNVEYVENLSRLPKRAQTQSPKPSNQTNSTNTKIQARPWPTLHILHTCTHAHCLKTATRVAATLASCKQISRHRVRPQFPGAGWHGHMTKAAPLPQSAIDLMNPCTKVGACDNTSITACHLGRHGLHPLQELHCAHPLKMARTTR